MEEIRIEHLTFTYAGASQEALCDISMDIRAGEFICVCGPSGCGKSTLLRQLKPTILPGGVQRGSICFDGRFITKEGRQTGAFPERELASAIGFVHQSPDRQIVSEKVWSELAFGLENLGLPTETIRRRIAEIAGFFGMESWLHKNVNELSGGQKQILNLASVMVMYPQILVLDEPTSQLDPIAAREFLDCLIRINREFGMAVLVTEHRLEDVLPACDRVYVMDHGTIVKGGSVQETGEYLRSNRPDLFLSMPTAMRLWAAMSEQDASAPPTACPVTAVQGHRWLEKQMHQAGSVLPVPYEPKTPMVSEASKGECRYMLSCDQISFRYDRNGKDILRGVSLGLYSGEMLAIVGANGAGKSTLLSILGGIQKPYRGTVRKEAKSAMLPQQPEILFLKKTVRKELEDAQGLTGEKEEKKISQMLSLCHLNGLEDRHPYDLSGGEMQRLALAKILLTAPEILILDEPTKGMDAEFKLEFAAILGELKKSGKAILMVSHDMEFCAAYADRCAMLFDGELVCCEERQQFFCDNHFYTTAARRISEGIIESAITMSQILEAWGGSQSDESNEKRSEARGSSESEENHEKTAGACEGPQETCADKAKKEEKAANRAEPEKENTLSRFLPYLLLLLAVPATLAAGEMVFHERKFLFISLLILLEVMAAFAFSYERKKPSARDIVIVSVLCALTVAGRAALAMFPEVKPVVAMVVISAISLGPETGFLVGAMSMLVSNAFFSQGAWTPWQMCAMGLIGLVAGLLHKVKILPARKLPICIYGFFSAIFIYGLIMNPAAALMSGVELNRSQLMLYYAAGFPMDLIHACATAVFLFLLTEPMLEKLERVKKL